MTERSYSAEKHQWEIKKSPLPPPPKLKLSILNTVHYKKAEHIQNAAKGTLTLDVCNMSPLASTDFCDTLCMSSKYV